MKYFNLNSIDFHQKKKRETSSLEVTFAVGRGKLQGSLTASLLPKVLNTLQKTVMLTL